MASASPRPKYIYDLPYLPQRDLALILDDNNQWKELGDSMQYNVTRLNEFGRTTSPTMAMFADWGQKNHTIAELFVLLSKMQHYRALEILMPYVEEKYHTLFRKGEFNLSKLLKTELGATAGPSTANNSSDTNSPMRASTGAKTSFDSCNFNSPGSERAFPSKLTPFELGQHQPPNSKPIVINQGDVTRSENMQEWNEPPQPVRAPNPSPQQHGPINGLPQRRDSESSGIQASASYTVQQFSPCPIFHQSTNMNWRLQPTSGMLFLFLGKEALGQSTKGRGKTLKWPLNGWKMYNILSAVFLGLDLICRMNICEAKKFQRKLIHTVLELSCLNWALGFVLMIITESTHISEIKLNTEDKQIYGTSKPANSLKKILTMLDFENQMFLDVLNEDGLVIAAKGIGLDRVFINLLKVYSDTGNLVIVLGTTSKEESFFIEELESMGVKPLPRLLSSEYSVNDRQSVYMEGGVIFSSSRILVVDMLMDRMPIHLVTGVLVYKAHHIIETSQEAFILRLYRQKNKKGFIKAFSSSPVGFTRGFSQVTRVMKSLYVRNLFLWPRFHATIQATLKENQPDVIELRLPLTPSMVTIQTAVLDLIQFSVKELRRINPSLDLDEMTVENALSKCFKKIIKFQLEPVWHQLSGKTKQLLNDLGTLRTLLLSLTQYDCVTYNVVVKSLRTTEKALKSAGWMLLDAAENLFITSKARVYGKSLEDDAKPELEENPKWRALAEVMKEVQLEIDSQKSDEVTPSTKILIVAEDDRTCHQLRQILESGSRDFLETLFIKSNTASDTNTYQGFRRRVNEETEAPVEHVDQLVIVQPLKGGQDPYALRRTLYKLRPRFVIMYDCDVAFVRQVEVYQAAHKEQTVRVYFLIYDASAEEQSYLTSLRREKEAFELLIREKATMVIPEDREGRTDDHPDFVRDPRKASEMALIPLTDTRQMAAKNVREVVVVDMREFRSELPSLLHRRGIDILPVTIEVGDYILTPDICVERKSLSDLIGSLNNGRLYNQSQEMCRHYAKPMLLIEFDHDKPFALQGKYYLSNDDSSLTDVTSRLQLLTLHFPRLRIVWSPGPYATAEIFAELKKGRDQPDPVKAASLSSDAYTEKNAEKYNPAIHVSQKCREPFFAYNYFKGVFLNRISS
nr:EOG090X03DI [Ceriodaphnia reticulata]